jgi:uncharacterized protein YjbI with pentapeptide repeats
MSTQPATKECPFCSEPIKATAKKCKHCGEILDGYTRDQVWHEINTGGGAVVDKGVDTGGGHFIGRDLNLGKDTREEQYRIVLNWDGQARLREFDLSGRDLSGLDLAGADLTHANLENTTLAWANLSGAVLRRADLVRSNLSNTDLSRADMSSANLYGANLSSANLSGATLSRTKLMEVTLCDVDLRGANLRGAYLIAVDLHRTRYNNQTRWPDGFIPPADAINVDKADQQA